MISRKHHRVLGSWPLLLACCWRAQHAAAMPLAHPVGQASLHHHRHADVVGAPLQISTATDAERLLPLASRQSPAARARGGAEGIRRSQRTGQLQVLGYFLLWYALNIWYNIVNKRVLNALPLPWLVGTSQLGVGSVWVLLQWLTRLRARPFMSTEQIINTLPVALFHGGGQVTTVLSLGAGAVSFTHIVKALEPFFSAIVSAIFLKQVFHPVVYLTLLPVVGGVALACYSEVNFSWLSFLSAMASNLFFACRANFSKLLMDRPQGRNMTPANLYAVVTMLAFAVLAPVALLLEGSQLGGAWGAALKTGHTPLHLATQVVLAGLSHYLNNEVMYLVLGSVHPVTLAVGNTAKRVFIIIASLIVFHNPLTKMGALGSTIGVLGVLVYSLTKQHYDKLAATHRSTPTKSTVSSP